MSEFEADTIERCPHDSENPYAQISRSLIRDKSLSPQCRWLIIYLLSNVDGWVIKTKQLRNHLQGFYGRDKILEMINEAIDAGYMKRHEYLKNNLTRYKYFVSESPKFKKSFRCPEMQGPEVQAPENTDTLKKDSSPSYEGKIYHLQEGEKAAPAPPIVYKSYKKVKIKEEKYQTLVAEFGEDKVKEMMERLDDYGDRKPTKFKEYNPVCHGAVVGQWLRDENKKVIDNDVKVDEQLHRQIAQQTVHNFPNEVAKNHIQLQNMGLLFCYGRVYELIEFKDIEFRDKLVCRLAQMNLDLGDI